MTLFRYYWHGPEVPAWTLRFHIIKNILRDYLAKSLPHSIPNEESDRIDFSYISDYIELNFLPSRDLTPDVGSNKEFDIVLESETCVEYELPSYAEAGRKLKQLAEEDMRAAREKRPRSISCQVVLGARVGRCGSCKAAMSPASNPEMYAPWPLEPNERIIIHFHGGAYCVGERSLSHLYVYANMSATTGLRIFSPNYRLAPRSCFPSQLHDCFLAYTYLLSHGFRPENIVLAGDSAGAALAMGLLFIFREMGLASPAGVVLNSPWIDLTCPGKSWTTNRDLDYLPAFSLSDPFHPSRMFYAAGRPFSERMLRELQCPLVSPIYGDLSNMPPMLIQMGCNELLRDDIYDFAAKVKQQNSGKKQAVKLEVYNDMPHAFVLFHFADAAKQAFECMGDFVQTLQSL
ncbi:alpha/beta-hydrolase [Martensiomyces pterosporus]|nr:alpha/beta-hydrolase [Martensiomyces pterosporus]